MKKVMFAVFFTAVASASIYAQPPAPPAGAPPPPPADGRLLPPPPPPGEQLQAESTYTGTVVKMKTNDDFVYDGFYMMNGKDSLLVKFPPHLGSDVTGAVKNGSSVSLTGVAHTTPDGAKEIRLKSVTANGRTISDTANRPALQQPPVEDSVSGSGKIASVQTDREGRVNGFILSNNTILRFPPSAAAQFNANAQNGSTVSYSGRQKSARTGEVSTGNYKVVHCQTISIGGKQYML